MQIYEFELKCSLPTLDADADEYAHALYAGGCDDALIGTGLAGKIAIRFSREADSAMGAIESAIRDVRRILREVRLIESGPDLVGLSEIAEHLGCIRQNVRKLMISNYTEFPQPFHDSKTQIWRLAEVLAWLKSSRKSLVADDCLAEVAHVNLQCNIVLRDLPNIDAEMCGELRAVVGKR